jgi:hypothetical protein
MNEPGGLDSRDQLRLRSRLSLVSRSRLLRLEGGVETQLRFLDHQDKLFEIVKIFSAVETYSLPVSRSRVSIETTSRQIKTPRLNNE